MRLKFLSFEREVGSLETKARLETKALSVIGCIVSIEVRGPYVFVAVNGVIRGTYFAMLDRETGKWIRTEDGTPWDAITLEP